MPICVVVWGWRQRRVIDAASKRGTPILVMERGHVQPRMEWTSCGLNGLARRGTYPSAQDGGARWRAHHAHHEQPWGVNLHGYALVCGQVLGDAALWGCDFRAWAQGVVDVLRARGMRVVYRPHPYSLRTGDTWAPRGADVSSGDAVGCAGRRGVRRDVQLYRGR